MPEADSCPRPEEPVTEFKITALKELAEQQTRFAPPARRQTQVLAAQKLVEEIEPARGYPYQYICYRVTEYPRMRMRIW